MSCISTFPRLLGWPWRVRYSDCPSGVMTGSSSSVGELTLGPRFSRIPSVKMPGARLIFALIVSVDSEMPTASIWLKPATSFGLSTTMSLLHANSVRGMNMLVILPPIEPGPGAGLVQMTVGVFPLNRMTFTKDPAPKASEIAICWM